MYYVSFFSLFFIFLKNLAFILYIVSIYMNIASLCIEIFENFFSEKLRIDKYIYYTYYIVICYIGFFFVHNTFLCPLLDIFF